MSREKIKQVQQELSEAQTALEQRSIYPFTHQLTKIELIKKIEWCEGYLQAVKDHWGDYGTQETLPKLCKE